MGVWVGGWCVKGVGGGRERGREREEGGEGDVTDDPGIIRRDGVWPACP